jgi:hypothetical protein
LFVGTGAWVPTHAALLVGQAEQPGERCLVDRVG